MNLNSTEIVLISAGTIGMLCFLTGLAMIYEPAAVLVLGMSILFAALAAAYLRGKDA